MTPTNKSADPSPAETGVTREQCIEWLEANVDASNHGRRCAAILALLRASPSPTSTPGREDVVIEKRWPFVESPGEFADRLEAALQLFGGYVLGAVRNVLIENPPQLEASRLRSPVGGEAASNDAREHCIEILETATDDMALVSRGGHVAINNTERDYLLNFVAKVGVTHPPADAQREALASELDDIEITWDERERFYDINKYMQHIAPCTGGGDQSCKCGRNQTFCNVDNALDSITPSVPYNKSYVSPLRKVITSLRSPGKAAERLDP